MALGVERLSLNLGTLGPGRAAEAVLAACARAGIRTVSPWRYSYEGIGAPAFARALRQHGLVADSLCRIAGLGDAGTPEAQRAALDEGRVALEEAAELGARSVTVIGGGMAAGDRGPQAARARVAEGLAALAPLAQQLGVALAVEPLHPMVAAERGCISTLALALELAEQTSPETGVMFDAYNCWWDPTLPHLLPRAAPRLLGFQISDWLVPTTDLAMDRGLMGEGVIDLPALRGLAESGGYAGPVEVEILSTRFWRQEIEEIIGQVVQRFGLCC